MLRQIVINVAVTTAVSVLTCLVYTKYFHRCDDSPDAGEELRRLVREWRAEAAGYAREAGARGEGEAVTTVYGAYGLAFDICALRLEAVLREAADEAATAGVPPPPPRPSKESWPSG